MAIIKKNHIAIAVVILYGLFFWLSDIANPLKLNPQLDGKELITLATQMATGTLPDEPFYRAPLYPATLALILKVTSPSLLPIIASFLGLLFHFLNTFIVGKFALHFWKDTIARNIAIVIYGLNPVALFYATLPFDVTFSLLLCLYGSYLIITNPPTQWKAQFGGCLLLGLAVLGRPHFLPLIPALLLITLALKTERNAFIPRLSGSSVVLIAFGLVQLFLFDSSRMLPWQGAYNLYAANRAGANGLYYVQQVDLPSTEIQGNPARLESEYLYFQETQSEPTEWNIAKFNSFWRSKFLKQIQSAPLNWLELMTFKTYALFNNHESYNNVTYAFHEERNNFLKWIPISWGILLVLASCTLLRKNSSSDLETLTLPIALTLAYAAGLLIFYVSARFRLPLYVALALLSPHAYFLAKELWQSRSKVKITGTIILTLVVSTLTFSNVGSINSTKTFIQDNLLLANANAELGLDVEAIHYAIAALEEDPTRQDALRISMVSFFNRVLLDTHVSFASPIGQSIYDYSKNLKNPDPILHFVLGTFQWNNGFKPQAVDTWKSIPKSQEILALDYVLAWQDPQSGKPKPTQAPSLELALKRMLPGIETPISESP